MEHIEIPPHVQRLREEHEQTEQRYRKLVTFTEENPIFKNLETDEQVDMLRQQKLMWELETILARRLKRALDKI